MNDINTFYTDTLVTDVILNDFHDSRTKVRIMQDKDTIHVKIYIDGILVSVCNGWKFE